MDMLDLPVISSIKAKLDKAGYKCTWEEINKVVMAGKPWFEIDWDDNKEILRISRQTINEMHKMSRDKAKQDLKHFQETGEHPDKNYIPDQEKKIQRIAQETKTDSKIVDLILHGIADVLSRYMEISEKE